MRYITSLLLLFFFEISFTQTVQTFDSSGSFTVPAGVYTLKVEAWGAGGAGGILTNGAKGGGGGGAYAIRNITVIPGATYTVTVGNGGVPTSTLAPSGGNSSFGSLVIAAGGNGASTTTGGAGGQASACTPIIGAINGTIGSNSSGNNGGAGGAGAIGGNGGLGGVANNGNGGPGIQPGGGGGGMAGPGGGGISGTGGAGRVVVTYTICSAPTVTCAANVTVNAIAPACSATTSLTRPTISNVCYRNHSLDFDGSNDYVALPSGLTSTFTNFTFEAWVYWDGPSSSTWERIMDFGSNTNVNMFLTPRSDSGTPRFAITTTGGGGEQRLTSPSALTTGRWHHIAVVLNDATNTGSLYINGQLMVQNTSITLTPASLGSLANNWIGRSQYADPYFNGKIDEVRIWNTTRTQAQIQANMNNEFASMPSGLIAYYKFNNGISCCSNSGLTTLANESGSNNGTLLNFGLSTSCTSNWTDGATPLGNPLTLSNSFNSSCVVTSGSFPAGVNNVTWTVTDGYGNTSTCVQTVTVNETQAPSITCPANISNTVTAGTCARTVTFTNPVGTDNCSGPVTIQTAGLASGSNFPVGVTTNTFRVTDASGNTATCSFTVTITDNELPGITCPANVSQNVNTGICGASATYSAPVGTDNCAGSSTLQTAGLASGATYPVGVTTNTFQVTDASGNTATCSFTVTVTDNQAPSITCPANVNQNVSSGTCGAVATYTAPVGTDNCPGSTTVRTAGLASGATYPVGVTTNTFQVTDASGNTATCSFTVTVTDNQVPSITCPANVNQNVSSGTCGAVATYTAVVGTDNCPGATTLQTAGLASGATYPVGVTTNTFRVTDASGNTATCSFTVTISDSELPVITCPANVNQNVASGTCGAVATYTAPVGTDNCPGSTTLQTAGLASGATFPVGTTTNTFRVTDASGNSATCSFTVTITDNELPGITCPANVSQNVTSGTCGRVVTFTSPVGSDNCSGPTTIQTAGFASGATFPVGTTTNTFRVTDASGNTATCSFTVTITDNELPSITCPANIGQNVTSGTCGRVVTYTSPVGSDNCSGPITIQTAGLASGATFPIGTTAITFRVTDASGNSATCSFTVIITDNELPSITCPANVNQNVSSGTCGAVATYTAVVGTDNCPGATTLQTAGLASGATYPVGVTTNTFRVTDASGNTATCSFTVTVMDNEPPTVFNCPIDFTIGLSNDVDPDCLTMGGWTEPTATDNCPGIITTLSNYGPFDLLLQGDNVVSYSFTDVAGNINSSCSFTVTVIDDISPIINDCPSNVSIPASLDGTGNCSTTYSWIEPTAMDDCDGPISPIQNFNPGSTFGVGVNNVVYEFYDNAGNLSVCSFDITVYDNEAPSIVCPASFTNGNTPGNCTGIVSYSTPNGTDNCPGSTTVQIAGLASGATYPVGVTTNTFRVTDASGNTATCSFTVTILDSELPVITCPANINQNVASGTCGAVATYTAPVGTDNCPGSATLQTAGLASGATFPVGTTANTFRVTDAAGNTATCSFTVTVTDNELPSITCPANVSQNVTSGTCGRVVTYTSPVSSDNCSGPTTIQAAGLASGATFPVGTTTNTFRVTDASGNTATCSFLVTVVDNEDPMTICQNITSYLNNGGTSTITATQINNGSSDACGISSLTLDNSSFTCANVGSNTVVLTVTDVNANTATCAATVSVQDTVRPIAMCQNISTYLNNGGTSTITATQINNGSSDACGIASLTLNNISFTCANIGSNTVVLTVTDVNANTATCAATVSVQDTVRPIAMCQNISTYLNNGGTSTIMATQVNNGSGDACGIASLTLNNSSFTCANTGSNTVVLTVTDVNANTATCAATVSVQDTVRPIAICQNITSYLNNVGTSTITATQINNGSGDACGIASLTLNNSNFTCANTGSNTVVLTVTDVNANTATCAATVSVQDTVRPIALCQNITSYLNNAGTSTITATQINNGSSDACGIASLSLNNSSFTCANVGSNTVVLTVTDVNGNTATCAATVNVQDTISPVTPLLTNVTLPECGGTPVIPVANDACAGMITATTSTVFPITAQGTTVVTWMFDDGNGNISSVNQNFLVDDVTPPSSPVLPTVSSDCLMPVTVTPPQAIDNCVGMVTATTADPLFYDAIGNYTIHWFFDDGNGNTTSTTQTVEISNAGAPVVINGQCFPSINAALTSGVVLGDVIHAYGNNLLESFEIPAGVTLEIHTGAVVINSGMVCNNGMILINGGSYINSGTYAGQGTFNGNFENSIGGVVKPGPCGN